MTPQLRQAIKILQLARAELETLVDQEMADNPLLVDRTSEEETTVDGEGGVEDEKVPPTLADVEWKRYLDDSTKGFSGLPAFAQEVDEERQTWLENLPTPVSSLAEYLLWQVRMVRLTPEEERIATLLIGNLDKDGYLQDSGAEIASQAEVGEEMVEQVLSVIQEFDPPGVGARDLRECLLLQLKNLDLADSLATTIVAHHLQALEGRRFDRLAKDLNVSTEEVAQAVRFIASLEPKPGRNFGEGEARYMVPDVYVQKVGNEYVITLNDEGLPRLRVSSYYRQLLDQEGEAKEYVKEKLRAAVWLIKSIGQRQRTLRLVAESLVKFQNEFLDKGVASMRPLVLRDVAGDIGMHESTVSRVVANKYIATPQGIYPLRYFFTTSLKGRQGQEVAAESVKEKIRGLISHEGPGSPLSDEDIAQALADDNVIIARRTVAKYRESMGILPSAKRRQPC